MWRVGMWYGDDKATTLGYVRSGAVVFAAFVVTGTIYLSLQRSMDAVGKRVTGTYSKGSGSDDVGTSPSFAPSSSLSSGPGSPLTSVNQPINSYAPVNAYRPSYSNGLPPMPTSIQPVLPPRPNIPTAYTLFTSDADRLKARVALADLRFTIKDFQDYESKGLQKSLAAGGEIAAPATGPISFNNIDDASNSDNAAIARQTAETAKKRNIINRINGETEALNAQISIAAHPDRFPDPLKDPVGEVSRELHTYLQDVRDAAASSEERPRLLSLASQHLSNAEAIIADMEQKVGTASGRNFP